MKVKDLDLHESRNSYVIIRVSQTKTVLLIFVRHLQTRQDVSLLFSLEGGVRVCGIAVLGYFWCGVAVIFISKYDIAVFLDQAVCGEFKFYVAVLGEKIVVSR